MTLSVGIYGLYYYDRREHVTTCYDYFEDEAEAQTHARRNNDTGTTTGSRWYVTHAVLHLKGEKAA